MYNAQTTEKTIASGVDVENVDSDFLKQVQKYTDNYFIEKPFVRVGCPIAMQGWLLHVSSIGYECTNMLAVTIPYLVKRGVSFKVPLDLELAQNIIDGQSGPTKLGKVLSVFPETDEEAQDLAKGLLQLCASFSGPAIPTDANLGGVVYTRYGSYEIIGSDNGSGATEYYITNERGKLIKDECKIPWDMPVGRKWPFDDITKPLLQKNKKFLNGRYLVFDCIKNDLKGKVIKGINLARFPALDWCLIKEGKQFMCMDSDGRDVVTRLIWQKSLHEAISKYVNVPSIIDYFQADGNGYLVMEFIEGESIAEVIFKTYEHNHWEGLSISIRSQLLEYLRQILAQIKRLHEAGYVHRDINPANFLVNKKKGIYLIDLELAFSLQDTYPNPAFTLGTQGYMSPEQANRERPTFKEDIYGIGGLLLCFFTGIHPYKIRPESREMMEESLAALLPSIGLTAIIADCLHPDPSCRPDLDLVITVIDSLTQTNTNNLTVKGRPDKQWIENQVKRGISGLSSSVSRSSAGYWHSRAAEANITDTNEVMEKAVYLGLHDGIAGVLYGLSMAKEAGFENGKLADIIDTNWNYVRQRIESRPDSLVGGLYGGAHGIALALAHSMRTKLLDHIPENEALLERCLNLKTEGLDIGNGIAGEGLALLHCRARQDSLNNRRLEQIIADLISMQKRDGSWVLQTPIGGAKGKTPTGFSHGVSGILSLMLDYYARSQKTEALESVKKGMKWLAKNRIRQNKICYWPIYTGSKNSDPWLGNGTAGVLRVFLKAYRITGIGECAEIAESGLNGYEQVYNSFTTSHLYGLSGLGELYLDASSILGTKDWQIRADDIARQLAYAYWGNKDSTVWLADYASFPTTELMSGNSGIIHFLIRYLNKSNVGYPLDIG